MVVKVRAAGFLDLAGVGEDGDVLGVAGVLGQDEDGCAVFIDARDNQVGGHLLSTW